MLSFQLRLTPFSNPDSPTVCAVDMQTKAKAEMRRERSNESQCGSKFSFSQSLQIIHERNM